MLCLRKHRWIQWHETFLTWFHLRVYTFSPIFSSLIHLAAAAKSLQSCPSLCDPIDGSHQAPPSLRFSRQEHWSGLPFPSPLVGRSESIILLLKRKVTKTPDHVNTKYVNEALWSCLSSIQSFDCSLFPSLKW